MERGPKTRPIAGSLLPKPKVIDDCDDDDDDACMGMAGFGGDKDAWEDQGTEGYIQYSYLYCYSIVNCVPCLELHDQQIVAVNDKPNRYLSQKLHEKSFWSVSQFENDR